MIVATRRIVATRHGEIIGRIVGVWDGAERYRGSYFERVVRGDPAHARPMGVNARYLAARERVEGAARPRGDELRS